MPAIGHGPFDLAPGAWTDGTGMAAHPIAQPTCNPRGVSTNSTWPNT